MVVKILHCWAERDKILSHLIFILLVKINRTGVAAPIIISGSPYD